MLYMENKKLKFKMINLNDYEKFKTNYELFALIFINIGYLIPSIPQVTMYNNLNLLLTC
jgi:hypothetical protein